MCRVGDFHFVHKTCEENKKLRQPKITKFLERLNVLFASKIESLMCIIYVNPATCLFLNKKEKVIELEFKRFFLYTHQHYGDYL